jgi:hypothetical protein
MNGIIESPSEQFPWGSDDRATGSPSEAIRLPIKEGIKSNHHGRRVFLGTLVNTAL